MPIISRFYGIAIMMYFEDHNPAHFHAKYGEFEAVYSLEGNLIDGSVPKRASKLVVEWLDLHQDELVENWRRAQNGEQPLPISPLE